MENQLPEITNNTKKLHFLAIGVTSLVLGLFAYGIFTNLENVRQTDSSKAQVPPATYPTTAPTTAPTATPRPTASPTITPSILPSPTVSSSASPSPTPASQTEGKKGDVTGDNKIDINDLTLLIRKWNSNDSKTDLNKNGKVDIYDLSILMNNW
ncbi:MAG: dockerin type I domain-containing protein [bacterium]|nr:dockerin type I domain-containing protein [bacterium]